MVSNVPLLPIGPSGTFGGQSQYAVPTIAADESGAYVGPGSGGGSVPNPLPVQGGNSLAVKMDRLRSKTSTLTTVSATATGAAGNVLALNANRLSYSIFNDSNAIMYVLQGAGVASATSYSFQTQAGGFYVTDEWVGSVSAAWSAANGQARITEYTP